jgi:hypothetical protein
MPEGALGSYGSLQTRCSRPSLNSTLHYDDIALQFGVAITPAALSKFRRTLAGRTRTAPAVFRCDFSDFHRFVTEYRRFYSQCHQSPHFLQPTNSAMSLPILP